MKLATYFTPMVLMLTMRGLLITETSMQPNWVPNKQVKFKMWTPSAAAPQIYISFSFFFELREFYISDVFHIREVESEEKAIRNSWICISSSIPSAKPNWPSTESFTKPMKKNPSMKRGWDAHATDTKFRTSECTCSTASMSSGRQ